MTFCCCDLLCSFFGPFQLVTSKQLKERYWWLWLPVWSGLKRIFRFEFLHLLLCSSSSSFFSSSSSSSSWIEWHKTLAAKLFRPQWHPLLDMKERKKFTRDLHVKREPAVIWWAQVALLFLLRRYCYLNDERTKREKKSYYILLHQIAYFHTHFSEIQM